MTISVHHDAWVCPVCWQVVPADIYERTNCCQGGHPYIGPDADTRPALFGAFGDNMIPVVVAHRALVERRPDTYDLEPSAHDPRVGDTITVITDRVLTGYTATIVARVGKFHRLDIDRTDPISFEEVVSL